MEPKLPWLEVLSPQAQRREIPLTQNRISIGREGYPSDLPLGPDSHSLISQSHCYLELRHSGWWLTVNGKNATLLCQNGKLKEIHGQVLLSDESTFCLLGLVENNTRLYWSITLHDPGQTQADPSPHSVPLSLKCDRARGTVWCIREKHTEGIELTPNEWKIIDYMLERNQHAHNAPVLCTNEELLEAVYRESFSSLGERLVQPKDNLLEEALTYIHETAKCAHLDITLGNILIQETQTHRGKTRQRIVLADFGLARVIDADGWAEVSRIAGTPGYRVPEQCGLTKDKPGTRSDIYSLGIVIGMMLTGLKGGNVLNILRGASKTHAPRLTPEVIQVLQQATNEDPNSAMQPRKIW